ncbi:MAG: hypothetical protein Q7S58_12775 [Candidatus Binatus sp.]|uniref:hypothetical protein n=1 Tax=Candidatus Binatus sp. TaxID=2811406 RepID=UPI002716DF45|nr:hypothetical protein [Candidatus Binatus sp.]MDO8433274.1 hypothetical protein [Candidatus Binatus sp.]
MKKQVKKTITWSAAVLALAFATPAFAQYDNNQPQQYASNESVSFPANYPWFSSSVPQGQSFQQYLRDNRDDQLALESNPGRLYDPEWRLQRPRLRSFLQSNPDLWRGLQSQGYGLYNDSFSSFLANHPRVASDLRSNPELVFNRNYVSSHPELRDFLANHPNVWRSLSSYSGYSSGRNPNRWGAYDTNRQWRDAYWWHDNQPDEFYENHSEWASLNPKWLNQDGAYDNQHQWHYGKWWYQQNPKWVSSNRPNWIEQHRYWQNNQATVRERNALIQQRQRQQALREENYRNRQLQATRIQQNRQATRQLAAREQRNRQDLRQQAARDLQNRRYQEQQAARGQRNQQQAMRHQEKNDRKVQRANQHREQIAARQEDHRAARAVREQNRENKHEAHEQNKQDRHDGKDKRHGNGNGNQD